MDGGRGGLGGAGTLLNSTELFQQKGPHSGAGEEQQPAWRALTGLRAQHYERVR